MINALGIASLTLRVYLFGHPLETAFAWNNCKSLNVRVFGTFRV
jgi:hypothetical protein